MFNLFVLMLQFFAAVIAMVAVILILGAIGYFLVQAYLDHKKALIIVPEPRYYASIYDQMVAERKDALRLMKEREAANSEFFDKVEEYHNDFA